jgi:hypothetical protein
MLEASPISTDTIARKQSEYHLADISIGLLLFFGTAATVLWQNGRVASLWDLSYVLENSYRISLGAMPYRDFPFPYAPLTFLLQAALIKVTGRVFFHHVLYCAAAGGVATVLTWRILLNLLSGKVSRPRLVAFALAAPLIVLGVYCLFPHPFYDCDCTLLILLCIFVLQAAERRSFPWPLTFLAGVLLVVPLFIKQNTGLIFLCSSGLLLGVQAWRSRSLAPYLRLASGVIAGLVGALLVIKYTVGLETYAYWTLRFAASRRLPSITRMITVYRHRLLPLWIAALLTGAWFLREEQKAGRAVGRLTSALLFLPFGWTLISLFVEKDSQTRSEALLDLWPFLLIVSFGFALLGARRHTGVTVALPFILICTVHGAFLSQQLRGSTYAIWPLFVIMMGLVIAEFSTLVTFETSQRIMQLVYASVLSVTIAGGYYLWSNERLFYVDLSGTRGVRSTLPALAGLSVPGNWAPEFDNLVHFAVREIPESDGLLIIPGEDPFYYATGRHPRLPVLMFDHTVNPYSAQEILQLSRSRNVQWLILKQSLQLRKDPVEDKEFLLALLRREFTLVATLDNYEIYKRDAKHN